MCSGARGGQKGELGSLELELQWCEPSDPAAGTGTQVPCMSSKYSSSLNHLSSPRAVVFNLKSE